MSDPDSTLPPGALDATAIGTDPLQLVPGTVLKETYRIDAPLGHGGMGAVFRCTHLGLDKPMAVKVLNARAIATPGSLERFEREAKIAGKVSHPAMTQVIDFGVVRGMPFLVMELVPGRELAELLHQQGAMAPRRAVAIMRQMLSLLRAAHALGIVHRDLKPANVKVQQADAEDTQVFVKVLDFGIAKQIGAAEAALTAEGMLVGTPAYMAPEQIAGQPVDARTDIYAAGLIFYEMLTGKPAYDGGSIAAILHAQMTRPLPELQTPVPETLRRTLQKLCAKDPAERFQDAAEADRALALCEEALRPPTTTLTSASVAHLLGMTPEEARRPATQPVAGAVPWTGSGPRPAEASAAAPVAASQATAAARVRVAPAEVVAMPQAPAGVEGVRAGRAIATVVVALVVVVGAVGAGAVWFTRSGRLEALLGQGSAAGAASPAAANTPSPMGPAPREEPAPVAAAAGEVPAAAVAAGDSAALAPSGAPAAVEPAPAGGTAAPTSATPAQTAVTPAPVDAALALLPAGTASGCYEVRATFRARQLAPGRYDAWAPHGVLSRVALPCPAGSGMSAEMRRVTATWPGGERILTAQHEPTKSVTEAGVTYRQYVVEMRTRVAAPIAGHQGH